MFVYLSSIHRNWNITTTFSSLDRSGRFGGVIIRPFGSHRTLESDFSFSPKSPKFSPSYGDAMERPVSSVAPRKGLYNLTVIHQLGSKTENKDLLPAGDHILPTGLLLSLPLSIMSILFYCCLLYMSRPMCSHICQHSHVAVMPQKLCIVYCTFVTNRLLLLSCHSIIYW